jgi:hypothetical protein
MSSRRPALPPTVSVRDEDDVPKLVASTVLVQVPKLQYDALVAAPA